MKTIPPAFVALAKLMTWNAQEAREETEWLELFAHYKFDGYHDFSAGMRFVESLVYWLKQFDVEDRKVAYQLVRSRLLYLGTNEMRHLVERFFPSTAYRTMVKIISEREEIDLWQALSEPKYHHKIETLGRKTLYVGLSDGAHIDALRHFNVGKISNEQVVLMTQPNPEKFEDILASLQKDVNDDAARFELIFLVDDFTGSGSSFLRCDGDKGKWKGKLPKFIEAIQSVEVLSQDSRLQVHHYVGSSRAKWAIATNLKEYSRNTGKPTPILLEPSFGIVLPEDFPLNPETEENYIKLAEDYYDPAIETEHTKVSGVDSVHLGFGAGGLPLILEHNTPNNSLAILWAETDGVGDRHAMRPLFRRRQRHI